MDATAHGQGVIYRGNNIVASLEYLCGRDCFKYPTQYESNDEYHHDPRVGKLLLMGSAIHLYPIE